MILVAVLIGLGLMVLDHAVIAPAFEKPPIADQQGNPVKPILPGVAVGQTQK